MGSAIDQGAVLVTGASSGIGMAIARQVASRAKALVLVARRASRLEELAKELRAAHPKLRVEVIACDLGDRAETRRLSTEVDERGLTVDVLVNNAGIGLMGAFDRADPEKLIGMIELNVTSLTLLTSAFVSGMIERGRGGILNISSGFGLAVMPSFAAYIATKHYGNRRRRHPGLPGPRRHRVRAANRQLHRPERAEVRRDLGRALRPIVDRGLRPRSGDGDPRPHDSPALDRERLEPALHATVVRSGDWPDGPAEADRSTAPQRQLTARPPPRAVCLWMTRHAQKPEPLPPFASRGWVL
jgi:hypothetical protein